eukprot:8904398-Heterocapsa_arctica.AAC.1
MPSPLSLRHSLTRSFRSTVRNTMLSFLDSDTTLPRYLSGVWAMTWLVSPLVAWTCKATYSLR